MTNNTTRANGWVYFLKANDAIKIGFSAHPKTRAAHLQTSHYVELKILVTVPTSVITERAAHAKFEHLRIRGEWFRAEPDLLTYIEGLSSKFELDPARRFRVVKPKRQPPPPEIRAMTSKLAKLRCTHSPDSRAHGIISNLIETLDNLAKTTDPTARKHLENYAAKSTKLIGQLLTAA